MIWFNEFVGKKPPEEITVKARFKLFRSLISENENRMNINAVKKEYKKKICKDIFLILISGFKLLSLLYTSLLSL